MDESSESSPEKIEHKSSEENNAFLIPASIIFAGILIAFSIYYTNGGNVGKKNQEALSGSANENQIKSVDASDHVFGNADAKLKLVEYSDLECPFCKIFHQTMKQIMAEYGKNGKVAWVYRHFPLVNIHPRAEKEAEASECAAEQGGNKAFWAYVDKIFSITPSNNKLDPEELPKVAVEMGLDKVKFESCLSSGKWKEKIDSQYREAIDAGGNGTPFTLVVTKSGKNIPISGALPYEKVKSIVDEALSE